MELEGRTYLLTDYRQFSSAMVRRQFPSLRGGLIRLPFDLQDRDFNWGCTETNELQAQAYYDSSNEGNEEEALF